MRTHLSTEELTAAFRSDLLAAGFNLVGFTPVTQLQKEIEKLNDWLSAQAHAGMQYMERNIAVRANPLLIDESFVSVISVALNYNSGHQHTGAEDTGKISRYAWGKDYHLIMWEKIDTLIERWKALYPGLITFRCVDTGPVMDKVWARKAGIGWFGKHTNIINRTQGSWFFLGTVFLNAELEYDTPVEDLCGSCTACLDACPTGAIEQPYYVNAGKCISYQTIENKGEIDENLVPVFDGWMFGCDVCQDVCPWNIKFGAETLIPEFSPAKGTELPLSYFDTMEPKEFKTEFAESPVLRAKLKGMQRNAEFLKRANGRR